MCIPTHNCFSHVCTTSLGVVLSSAFLRQKCVVESKIVFQQFDYINWCSPNQKQNFVLESISGSPLWNLEAQYWGPMKKARKRQKSENVDKGIQRKMQWCFQQTWLRNILQNTCKNHKIFFVSYKLNRPWWNTDIYEVQAHSLLDSQVFFWIHIP